MRGGQAIFRYEETMVINHKVPNENPETGDEDDHNETVVSEDILETSHNHNVTLTGPTDTQPGVTDLLKNFGGCLAVDFVFLPWIRTRKTLEH